MSFLYRFTIVNQDTHIHTPTRVWCTQISAYICTYGCIEPSRDQLCIYFQGSLHPTHMRSYVACLTFAPSHDVFTPNNTMEYLWQRTQRMQNMKIFKLVKYKEARRGDRVITSDHKHGISSWININQRRTTAV